MVECKPRYRHARLKAGRDKTVLRCRVESASPIPTNKPYLQFLFIFFHHQVSDYFSGHLMHQSTQQQKVRGNSRLHFRNPSRLARSLRQYVRDLPTTTADAAPVPSAKLHVP